MSRETVSNPATPTVSAGTSHAGPGSEKTGSAEQASKGAQAQDRIARRAYELYEQRGRQEGRALEDWLKAERQLVGVSRKS
jgi:hypothetical protein